MKSALIFFRNVNSVFEGEYINSVTNAFDSAGFSIDTIEILSDIDDLGFKRRLIEFKDMFDNIVVLGGDAVRFDLKDIIAQTFDTAFVENENARNFLDAVSKANAIDYSDDFAMLPIEGTVIPNIYGGFQGFILDSEDLTLSLLPFEIKEIKTMCDKYLLPYLENKLGIKKTHLTLKCFGELDNLKKTLEEAENIGEKNFSYSISQAFGDITVNLLFDYECDEQTKKEIIRYIVSNQKENVYAEYDVSLAERLFDLLKLRKLKLSTAESFTSGRVVNEIIKNVGASEVIHEGLVCYSNQSKIKRLGVKEEDLRKQGAVSSVVAYQMAVGLLRDGCDVAISTTGIAGPKSDDTDKPIGLCYIGIGMKDGVHTYRYKLSGTREEITQTARNTALFLAIRKLKTI